MSWALVRMARFSFMMATKCGEISGCVEAQREIYEVTRVEMKRRGGTSGVALAASHLLYICIVVIFDEEALQLVLQSKYLISRPSQIIRILRVPRQPRQPQ